MVATSILAACTLAFQFANEGPIVPRVRPEAVPAANLKVDVPLALIPAHVTTQFGATVTNLTRESFHVFENGVEQKITHFASEDAPISIGLLFDSSGSMRNKIRKSAEAAAAFFRTANTDDEFFLVEFNERAKLSVPFTRDSNLIYQHIVHARPEGRTSLLDAIHVAMAQMKDAKNLRKAIVILSDGGDNRSRHTESEIKRAMRESDVQVYALGIFDPDDVPKKTPEEKNGPQLLGDLASESGGRHFPIHDLADLPSVCERIGTELRNQYLIGYSSPDGDDNEFRHVKVSVEGPDLRVYYRQGYYPAGARGN